MGLGFDQLVEQRIQKAQADGKMADLPGKGKPLDLSDMKVPELYRNAHRILKNAGFLPPEVTVRKEIEAVKTLLDILPETAPDYPKLQKKLAVLINRLNHMRGPEKRCRIPGAYRDQIIKRMS